MNEGTHDLDEFQDPLENYEPKDYDDPLEQALVEEVAGNIRHEPFTTIPPETLVHDAVRTLARLQIACLLVSENDKLIGVFSERDVLSRVAFQFDEIKDRPIRDFMTTDPIFVYEMDSAVASLSVMALCGCRHVPVLDLNENLVGIISPQRVTDFLRRHFKQN